MRAAGREAEEVRAVGRAGEKEMSEAGREREETRAAGREGEEVRAAGREGEEKTRAAGRRGEEVRADGRGKGGDQSIWKGGREGDRAACRDREKEIEGSWDRRYSSCEGGRREGERK